MIRREVNEGRQAYIVYPLIDESETLSAKAATKEKEVWQNEVFPEFKIGLLHGKLKNDEKDEISRYVQRLPACAPGPGNSGRPVLQECQKTALSDEHG